MKLLIAICLVVAFASGHEPRVRGQYDPPMIVVGVQMAPLNPAITCWNTLNCSIGQIESMKIRDRIEFVQFMARSKLRFLESSNQFRAVEGTMDFFVRKSIANRGTWMSYINAAVVEAIQRGAAIALGESDNTGGNPATLKWADYFDQRKLGRLMNRDAHDRAWAVAEQTAVEYGIRLANSKPDIETPTTRERRWQQFTKIYRMVMQYRRTLLWLIKMAFNFTSPGLPMASEAFLDWFTDVTDATSTGFLAEIAWTLCALGLSWDGEDPIKDLEVILGMVTEFWEAFQTSRHLDN
ncbi:uncharacterized protein CIMG_06965 [Coccidioides immitis RS]|uniref:Uncharacterized protein n=3 Tax=Coccidioides immitis TaxID=5501 RepID=J3K9C3_COCIM|nr:uncharacterized protein CIMG_06965 [Coccidioides immitis RS]EAS31486.3 hypothetical protein CIMG_06965 [Coccidioides immitis RS]KMP04124.1 hypothetical protein CIRG_03815 [Coccidioides immitis RMSCC 2394]TPX24261.1 hypothetical protein DIZ76_013607 [Coccidioides immitis]